MAPRTRGMAAREAAGGAAAGGAPAGDAVAGAGNRRKGTSASSGVRKPSSKSKKAAAKPKAAPARKRPDRGKKAAKPTDRDHDIEDDPADDEGEDDPAGGAGEALGAGRAPIAREEAAGVGRNDGGKGAVGPGPRASPSDDGMEDYWPNVQVLAEVQDQFLCKRGEEDEEMIVELQVHNDPGDFGQARLGYRARFSLVRDGISLGRAGYVHAWRINKTTTRAPAVGQESFINQLLTIDVETANDEIRETATCMQALFDEAGAIKPRLEDFRAQLMNNSILFIQMVHIFEKFQKRGLALVGLNGVYDLLTRLPEWYNFTGTALLVPAKPAGPRGSTWKKMRLPQVEDKLHNLYERAGFTVYVKDSRVQSGRDLLLINVMGRTVHIAGVTGGEAGVAPADGDKGKGRLV